MLICTLLFSMVVNFFLPVGYPCSIIIFLVDVSITGVVIDVSIIWYNKLICFFKCLVQLIPLCSVSSSSCYNYIVFCRFDVHSCRGNLHLDFQVYLVNKTPSGHNILNSFSDKLIEINHSPGFLYLEPFMYNIFYIMNKDYWI